MPSNNPKQIIKDGQVIDNQWTVITEEGDSTLDNSIVPLTLWQSDDMQQREDVGVLLTNDIDLDKVDSAIFSAPVIAIEFPVFMDGRGFSLARLLRERHHYQGEIRAVGHIIRDQLYYLKRCGFNAFSFDEDVDLNAAVDSLDDFTEAYQTSVDKPEPLFRRRA